MYSAWGINFQLYIIVISCDMDEVVGKFALQVIIAGDESLILFQLIAIYVAMLPVAMYVTCINTCTCLMTTFCLK